MLISLSLVIISAFISLTLTPYVRAVAYRLRAVDEPGERKIHATPIPCLGGVSVALSVVLTALIMLGLKRIMGDAIALNLEVWSPGLTGGMIVLLAGVWDDIRPIPAWVKFCFQVVATGVTIWLGMRLQHISLLGSSSVDLGWLSVPLTALWLVGITNAFNLVDGLDGLAAGLGIIAACSSATIFVLVGGLRDAMLLFILIGALLGFLRYNFNPASIFLGDSGSMFTGYMLAVTAIIGTQRSSTTLAVIIPLLIFGLPIADTLLSMLRRFVGSLRLFRAYRAPFKEQLLGAKRMFQPDQRHIHHRLLALGFSHRKAVLLLYALAMSLSALALVSVLAQYRNAGIILLAVGLATYIGIRKLGYEELTFLRTGALLRWSRQLASNRLFFPGFVDLMLITGAYWGAFLLKYGTPWTAQLVTWYMNTFPFVLVIQLAVFYACGLYRGVWRAAEISDLVRVALTVLPTVALSYTLVLLSVPPQGVLSFFCIDALILSAFVVGARSTYHILDYMRQQEETAAGTALIYGAGRGGQLILRALRQNLRSDLHPIGFLDDDTTLHGRMVSRMPVLGSGDDLKSVIASQPVSSLIISSSHINGYRLRKTIGVCQERGIAVLQGCIQFVPVSANGVGQAMPEVQHDTDG